jgi:hypothetical protein
MKNIILFFLILSNTFVFSQTSEGVNYKNTFNEVNEKPQKNITYKIQVLSSSVHDMIKFKYFLEEYKCEIEYHKTKIGSEVYRYMISPKENTWISANMLLEETTFNFQNPYIVVYYKNKRQN